MNTFETILVTCVTFHVTHNSGYTFYQKCMSLALTFNEGMCLGDLKEIQNHEKNSRKNLEMVNTKFLPIIKLTLLSVLIREQEDEQDGK